MSIAAELPSPLPQPVEFANRLSHGIGLALAIAGTAVLVSAMAEHGDALQVAGVSIYGATLIAVYAASTLSHTFERPRLRHFFRTVDQVCIFLLIAGTFTPISLTFFRHGWWWALFISVWAVALFGIVAKIFYTRLHNVAVSAYVLNGWLPIVAIKPIVEIAPGGALAWMLVGGLCYTAGVVFLMRDDRVPIFHTVWHVFVIGGSACHYYAMYEFVVPWGQ
jgi:hemolysin III